MEQTIEYFDKPKGHNLLNIACPHCKCETEVYMHQLTYVLNLPCSTCQGKLVNDTTYRYINLFQNDGKDFLQLIKFPLTVGSLPGAFLFGDGDLFIQLENNNYSKKDMCIIPNMSVKKEVNLKTASLN